MKKIFATKYYSHGKYSDLLEAQNEVERLSERHPDRDYTIFINMRGNYKRYTVVQVKEASVMWPEDKDLDLPPEPIPPKSAPWGSPAWQDYRHEMDKRREIIAKATAPLKAILQGKLNP
jgi:hypothetical protein